MSADPTNPFDELGDAERADTFGAPAPYHPPTARPNGRARRWIVTGVVVLLLGLVTIPVLGLFGVRLWPENGDEFDALALTNRHGGPGGVYFSARVTRDEALRAGRVMIDADALGGPGGADVLLDREGDTAVVSVFGSPDPKTRSRTFNCSGSASPTTRSAAARW